MNKVNIGQDLSCYAEIEVPEDVPLTEESLSEIVGQILSSGEWMGKEVMFDCDWATTCA